ncbi:MAG TPA: VOC family protein [Nitrososphaeraceae archaeon]|jgi:predicted enzyme related to lactoylglutathione lyase|nr:VOC family protein [Nitrososphaeraceae archaeon]
MNPVVHFEMPYENRERIVKFYQSVFSWQTQMLGEEMGNYVLVTTTESDENGPKELGSINGGFSNKGLPFANPYPSFVIAVDDINESIKKIANAGGKILGEPMEIPGVGVSAWFVDTEGNRLSVLQPLPHMSVRPKSE